MAATQTAPVSGAPGSGGSPSPARIYSLDVFRGLTMVWMVSNGFGLQFYRDHPSLGPVARQFTHADWHGMLPWDLIQPFFMFIVGVAMPFAFRVREQKGETWAAALPHVLRRCALLLLCGTVARSIQAGRPVLDLINVLAQIAFTYLAAYLVLHRGWRTQALAAGALLAVHTGFYLLVQAPGVTGPWDKNANIGWWLDGAILGKHWGGGYATINCVSSAANTIFGVMAGWLLMSTRPAADKIRLLVALGAAGIAAGWALDGWIPIIKKIWTASFALYSTGFTLLALALAYWLLDVKQWRAGSAIFAIVGANSIFIYLFHEVLYKYSGLAARTLIGEASADTAFARLLWELGFIGVQVAACWWLYRRRIFLKL